MSGVVALVIVVAVIAAIAFLIAKVWNRRPGEQEQESAEILPYLILALAVGVAGFSFARLARVALTLSQLAGGPRSEIAAALAGLVVAAPIAFFLWRRQRRRRRTHPRAPGWPVYLSLIEIVFLTAFFAAASQVANGIAGIASLNGPWTDLIVYGGIVSFHWWVASNDPPQGEVAELPRLIGSGVALIALAIGLQGMLHWLLSEVYEATLGDVVDFALDQRFPEHVAGPLGLLIVAAPIWAWRWLRRWEGEPSPLRHLYLGAAAVTGLATALGAAIVIVATMISFWLTTTPARLHFADLPNHTSALIVAFALWAHHRRRMGAERTSGVRGYEYAMAAVGLGAMVVAGTTLVAMVWETPLAGDPGRTVLIASGLTVIVGGAVWLFFWRSVQRLRVEERRTTQRRFYLIGMAVIMGLTTAGALIAALVVAFQAALAESGGDLASLPIPAALTVLAGAATWHLLSVIRADGPAESRAPGTPFPVTVVCSHPGPLATVFPKEAMLRVLHRNDEVGVIDDEMAQRIVAAVDGRPSIVWVDQDGFRVAPLRST
jgi:hypothetical protein